MSFLSLKHKEMGKASAKNLPSAMAAGGGLACFVLVGGLFGALTGHAQAGEATLAGLCISFCAFLTVLCGAEGEELEAEEGFNTVNPHHHYHDPGDSQP